MMPDMLQMSLAFLLPILPLLAAGALFLPRLSAPSLRLAPLLPLTALPLLLLHGEVVELSWLLLGSRVGVNAHALPLLLLAILAWTLAGWHARRHLPVADQPRFFLFWLLSWTGNLCVFITLDMASFYAAYAMMSFSAYGLVIFYRRPEDYRAGRIYLGMAILGEAFILGGLFLVGSELGNAHFSPGAEGLAGMEYAHAAAWLFAIGFAVKMGLVPLHMWLPLAHPQAPVPASAVLSGVILKAGLIGWLRFLPHGSEGFEPLGMTLLLTGLLTAFFGVLVGLCQDRAKVILAYSSISQMGLIASAVGAALAFPEHATPLLTVAVLFALHHGLAKTALFLGVDTARQGRGVNRLLLWLPALALAGAPLSSGALSKVWLKSELPQTLAAMEPVLLLSSLGTTLLMARFLTVVLSDSPSRQSDNGVIHWWLLLVAMLGLPWLIAGLHDTDLLSQPFAPGYLLETLLPVLGGGLIAWAAWRGWPWPGHPAIPAGDLIVLFARPLPRIPALPHPAMPRPDRLIVLKDRLERQLTEIGPALLVLLGLLGMALAIALSGR